MNLGYHATALRYSRGRWRPFRAELADWLRDAVPAPSVWEGVLIIGPSGAYCLPPDWLAEFRAIRAYEPDPVARWIFQRRFGARTSVEIESRDVLGLRTPGRELAEFRAVLAECPGYLVLFSNVLGQLRFGYSWIAEEPHRFDEWKAGLQGSLGQRAWISFHDRLSGELRPEILTHCNSDRELTSDELLSRFFPSGGGGELLDHLTGGIFPEMARVYFRWELAPRHHHLIEGLAQFPQAGRARV